MIAGVPFIPPVWLNAEDVIIQQSWPHRVGVYRPSTDGDGTWELEAVYTFQDGAYRLIVDAPPLRKELPGHDPNDHADPLVDG